MKRKTSRVKHMSKRLEPNGSKTLMAAIRNNKQTIGPNCQPVGSITNDPAEVDRITIEAWTAIYKEAGWDQQGRTDTFMKDYAKCMFQAE